MSSNKYNERVKLRAKELCDIMNPMQVQSMTHQIDLRDKFIPAARLSVAREAEAYIECYHYGMSEESRRILNNVLQSQLIEKGLIPPPNETT